jgi:RNA polymerase sigma-70 factor (ECF subfamily)
MSDHVTDLLLESRRGVTYAIEREEKVEELTALRECLAELPRHSRELLQLRYFNGLSPGAIGSHLGRTSNQTRQALMRLRRALLKCMEHRLGAELA